MLQPENALLSAPAQGALGKVFSDLRPIKASAALAPQATHLPTPRPPATNLNGTNQSNSNLKTAQPAPLANVPTNQVEAGSLPLTRPNPAGKFHATTEAAKPAFLDLRNMPLKTAGQEFAKSAPPINLQIAQPSKQSTTPDVIRPQVPAAIIISAAGRTQERLAKASTMSKSETISKFGKPLQQASLPPVPVAVALMPILAPVPAIQAAPATPANPTPMTSPPVGLIGRIVMPQTVKSIPAEPTAQLPNAVMSQIESLAKAEGPATAAQNQLERITQTSVPIKPTFKPASAIACAVAIVIMGGYTWVNNYPKMSIKAAAGKAGIEASLPSYVPSNFTLATKVDFAPGEVTLNLHNAQTGGDVAIKQRATTWDSSSLLENYVAKDSSVYSSVQGQGLTIYLFDKNKASWVNHGIWYSIDGNAELTRDQILKIAYSL